MSDTDKKIPEPFPAPKAEDAGNPVPNQAAQPSQTATAPKQNAASPQAGKQAKVNPFTRAAAQVYMQQPGDFDLDLQKYAGYASNKTGYANLDKIQPFYPGLYALGAISSLGKTTFAHQMADQLAAMGQVVLYFSLEQNRFEMFTKSLSRGFFRTWRVMMAGGKPVTYPTPSSIEIRRGDVSKNNPTELDQQRAAYMKDVGNRLLMYCAETGVTVESIIGEVDKVIKTGVKPVVIVDYLQIIAPTLVNGRIPDTKSAIDHIVHELKVMQSKHSIPVIMISSLNRANYLAPIDFESFKESGGIEYTADVVWGLQLAILRDPNYIKEKSIVKQREMIQNAKKATPRAIDLVCLKNRYGLSSYSTMFDYFPANDCFLPAVNP